MTIQELIDRLRALPGDKELRPVKFARQHMNYLGHLEWVTSTIEEVSAEPMEIWLQGELAREDDDEDESEAP